MDSAKILTRINNLEAIAESLLDECRKTKELLGRVSSPAARKGQQRKDDIATMIRANRRKSVLGHV